LQAIKDIPIYTKIIKDICIKKPVRKGHENNNVKIMIQMIGMILDFPLNYNDLGNPIVIIEINGTLLRNTLADLGVAINDMTIDSMTLLKL